MRPLNVMLWCHLRVLNGAALPCRRLAVYSAHLSGGINQMTVFEITVAVLHCLSNGLRVCIMIEYYYVAVNWVCAWLAVHTILSDLWAPQ